VFEVVGSNIIYDGAVWQELNLQEISQNTWQKWKNVIWCGYEWFYTKQNRPFYNKWRKG
jgi:hypothetical protein